MASSEGSRRRISQGSFGGPAAEIPARGTTAGGGGRVSNRDGSSREAVAPRPAAPGGIGGRVVTSEQQAVSGAAVAISGGPPHPDIAAVTDDEGQFSLGDLSPGQYQLTVHKQGYQAASVQF